MMILAKRVVFTLSALALIARALPAQSIPADTSAASATPGLGFSLPSIGGTLNYGISAAELVSSGFFNNSGVGTTTNISGDVAYVSKSQFHPFSAIYDGGVLIANSGQPNTFFQTLTFSQVLNTKHWNFIVSDSVSYLPQSPAVGLSGIPGVGDLGVDPVTTVAGTPGLGILTTYGPRVSNATSATASRTLTARMSVQGTGNYFLQRFIGDNSGAGLNSTGYGGSGGLTYQLSSRDTLSGNYVFSKFTYTGYAYDFTTQGALATYSRRWSPRLSTTVFGGPQFTQGSGLLLDGSFVSFSGGGSASYSSRSTSYTAGFSRGVNNGSGVLPGAISNSFILSAQKRISRDWNASLSLSYSRNNSLPILNYFAYNTNSLALSGQATRRLGRYLSGYGSYTLEQQSTQAAGSGFATNNAFSGFYQVLGVGITYSPRNIPLNR